MEKGVMFPSMWWHGCFLVKLPYPYRKVEEACQVGSRVATQHDRHSGEY